MYITVYSIGMRGSPSCASTAGVGVGVIGSVVRVVLEALEMEVQQEVSQDNTLSSLLRLLFYSEDPIDAAIRLQILHECAPMLGITSTQSLEIAHDNDRTTCTCERDVEASEVGEEADAVRGVGARGGQNDDVLLATLEAIHAADLHRGHPRGRPRR